MNNYADLIIETLTSNNFEAYYVGGSVRNMIHNNTHNDNLTIKDFDIVTNASYDQIKTMFDKVEDRGESFNVAIISIKGEEFEVAQYRGEKYPEGGSTRPSEVYNVDTLEEDILRRDFKMNGIVVDKNGKIIDLVGGLDDIKNRIISTIGDPNQRFSEDPLRILRAIRFVSQLNYSIEKNTLSAMVDNVKLLKNIPHSRVEGEFSKIIKSKHILLLFTYLKTVHDSSGGIIFLNTILGKEVKLMNSFLSLDLFEITNTVNSIKPNLSAIEFYYSLYKNFDADLVEKELKDMQITNKEETKRIVFLIKHRDIIFNKTGEKLLNMVRDLPAQYGRKLLIESFNIYKKVDDADFADFEKVISRPLFIKELRYNGHSVQKAGVKYGYKIQGKLIGEVLEKGREQSVLGNQFNLRHILELLKDQLPKNKD